MPLPSSQQSPSKCPSICTAISLTYAFGAFVSGCVFLTIDQDIDNVPDNQRFIDMLTGGVLFGSAFLCLCLAPMPIHYSEKEHDDTYSALQEGRTQGYGSNNPA